MRLLNQSKFEVKRRDQFQVQEKSREPNHSWFWCSFLLVEKRYLRYDWLKRAVQFVIIYTSRKEKLLFVNWQEEHSIVFHF